jgi:hypothetical protein
MVAGRTPDLRGASAEPVLAGSHTGNELTIAVDIARYTATDAIDEGLALNLALTAAASLAGVSSSG